MFACIFFIAFLTVGWAFDAYLQDDTISNQAYRILLLESETEFLQEQLDELYDKVFALEDLTEVLHDDTVEEAE